MGFFAKSAEDIKEKALNPEENQSGEKKEYVKRHFLNNGDTIKVRIPDALTYQEYWSHGGYNLKQKFKVYPFACENKTCGTGKKDPYDLAVEKLYEDRKEIEAQHGKESTQYKELDGFIYEVKAKRKMLFGFINLADGEEIVVEVSGQQGDGLITQIVKNEKKLMKYAFEVYKNNGTVNLTLLDPEDDLSQEELSNFNATKGQIFNRELFEKSLFLKDEKFQVMDLVKIGFDVSRIGMEAPADEQKQTQQDETKTEQQPEAPKQPDLPF